MDRGGVRDSRFLTADAVRNDKHSCTLALHTDDSYPLVVKASVSSVFCSTSWALLLPVAGLAPELRFTLSTGRPPEMRFRRGSMLNIAPMLAGSSCTQTISAFGPWRSNSATTSFSGNG